MTDKPKTKRRWFQFSLRALLILMAVASLGFGWLGLKLKGARERGQAAEVIRRLGGYVTYDYQFVSGQFNTAAPIPGPSWLRSVIGDDLFVNVVGVALSEAPVTDADLIHLECLTRLKYLHLDKTNVTDSGLVRLRGLRQLSVLVLCGTNVTDAGLKIIGKMDCLQSLDLSGTAITDDGLQNLRAMPQLETLNLMYSKVSDVGLVHLRTLPKLQKLYLYASNTTNQGREDLQKTRPNLQMPRIP